MDLVLDATVVWALLQGLVLYGGIRLASARRRDPRHGLQDQLAHDAPYRNVRQISRPLANPVAQRAVDKL